MQQNNNEPKRSILEDYLPRPKPRKTPKARYIKPKSVKQLEEDHMRWKCRNKKYPDMPEFKNMFRDDTANGLTDCIKCWLTINGYFAARVNTQGTYSKKLGRYIKSGATKGMADITSVINGRHVSIEVKIGKDKPRELQLQRQKEIEAAGGVYIFVKSLDNFLEQVENMLHNIK